MGLFDKISGRGRLKIPPRHRRAAYMNLAYKVLPVATDAAAAAWDTPPDPLCHLTDELSATHLTTTGTDNDAVETFLEIDLGREYEVYEIYVRNRPGEGFTQLAGGANLDVTLETGVTGDTPAAGSVIRDTQVLPSDGAYYDSTLHWQGEGMPVRYVWVVFTPDGTRIVSVDLSQIEVFGC